MSFRECVGMVLILVIKQERLYWDGLDVFKIEKEHRGVERVFGIDMKGNPRRN